jgi:ketosteroid isomerase-like protein
MSQENVETAKRCVDAFDRRDLDELTEISTADYEWVGAFLGVVEGGSYRGREGMVRYFSEAEETWQYFSVSGEEFRDLGDRVLVVGRMEGRGRGSGVKVDTSYTMVVEFREGKVARSRAYLDHGDALRAVGLAESAMSQENVEIEDDPEDAAKALLNIVPEAEPLEDPDKEHKLDWLRKASADELADPSIRVKLVQEAREAGATPDEIDAALGEPDPGP